MFTWMRTHQRWLMLLITIIVIISFVWLFNARQIDTISTDGVARIYGRKVTYTEIQKDAHLLQLALMLGLSDFASTLEGTNTPGAGEVDFVLNSMILRHEGRELGIDPTDDQVANAVKELPVFQSGGQFDLQKYQSFLRDALAPRGFVPKHIDQIVKDSLILQEVTRLIDAAPTATDEEVAVLNRGFEPATGKVVLFNRSDFEGTLDITEEDIDAYYTVSSQEFVTPEWRTANYVRFDLPEDAAKLEGPAKIEAQQKIADEAAEFAEKAATEGLQKAADAAGYTTELTLPFDRQGNIDTPAGDANMEALRGPAAAIAPTVFTLTENSPVSGVIADGQNFIVAELDEVTPARQLTMDEARPTIVTQLGQLSAESQLQDEAIKIADQLKADLKAGKSFDEAAAALNLETEAFADIAPLSDNPDTRLRVFADATTNLKENEISGFVPTEEGGALVWLEKRSPSDAADAAERKEQIADFIVARKRNILFYEWLIWAREKSGLQMGQG